VDFTNYTGQLTGIRIKVTADANNDPTVVFQQLLGNQMNELDVKRMFERCNGDPIIPSLDGGTLDPNTTMDIIWPEAYQALLSPAVYSAMLSGDQAASQKAVVSVFPIYNVNITRNTKIAPVNLVNQNIKTVFNNIYGNLQRNGVILQSVILDNTNEYPRKMCAAQPTVALAPKIIVNENTTIDGFTAQTSLVMISEIFQINQSSSNIPKITMVDETGNSAQVELISLMNIANQVRQTGGSGSSNLSPSTIQAARDEMLAVRTYTISILENAMITDTIKKMADAIMFFSSSSIYHPESSKFFFSNSAYFTDSIKQAYFTQLFIGYSGTMSLRASLISKATPNPEKYPFKILSYRLSNPGRDYTIETGTGGGSSSGGGIGSSSMCSGANSGSDASLLQSLRNLLCV